MEKKDLFTIGCLFILFSSFGTIFSQNTCEKDWEPYKNEKCLRVFDSEMKTYDEAEIYCKQTAANLVSIGLEEKQKFVESFLKSKGILNEIWIGLKYESDNNYVWSGDADFHYENWDSGSPKNDPSYCVQMYMDVSEFGKWADVLCTKKNVVLCEKSQPWDLTEIQNEILYIKQNLIPIGFMYVQLPKEKPPSEIWPWMKWEDLSSDYAGVFFRVEGGNSSAFGSVQEEDSPRLIEAIRVHDFSVTEDSDIPADGKSHSVHSSFYSLSDNRISTLKLTVSASEVRPRNMASRIWKRTN